VLVALTFRTNNFSTVPYIVIAERNVRWMICWGLGAVTGGSERARRLSFMNRLFLRIVCLADVAEPRMSDLDNPFQHGELYT
jgi:hypothetical protein